MHAASPCGSSLSRGRENLGYIAAAAPRHATMASEIPGVVDYYLEQWNRRDIRSAIMSQPGFSLGQPPPDFVLLQRGRVYIESLENFAFVEDNFPLAQSSSYDEAVAARVFRRGRKGDARLPEVTGVRQQAPAGSSVQ